jgi:transposase
MLNMSQQITIREMRARGSSVTEIAQALNIDRKTVYHYLGADDFSPKPPVKKVYSSKLDPYKSIIESWLEDDKKCFSKQRHTYRRIKERLKEEYGFDCAYGTIADFMRKTRGNKVKDSSLDLVWEPGFAQVDFGQADAIEAGEIYRCHYLVMALPFSNDGFPQTFYGESGECFCQGLKDIFEFIGGVPPVIIFDNASGIGQRKHQEFVESELFARFRMHYGFEARFCRPASGQEKGTVERKVAFLRNELFVPVPVIDDIVVFNKDLLIRSRFQESERHYAKGCNVGELVVSDFKKLLPLPKKPFNCVRYEVVTSNGWGHVKVDGNHTYSSDPANANAETIVEIGAHTIKVMDMQGTVFSNHVRKFGETPTESIETASQLKLLINRPRGWQNSKVRQMMPASVVSHLDALPKDALRRDLKLLYETSERSGLKATLSALEVLAHEQEEFPDFFQVGVLAARIADFGIDTTPIPGADLSSYDKVFLGSGQDA